MESTKLTTSGDAHSDAAEEPTAAEHASTVAQRATPAAPASLSGSSQSNESQELSDLLLADTKNNSRPSNVESDGTPRSHRRRFEHAPWQNLTLIRGAVAPEHRPPLPHQRHTSIHWFRHGLRLHDNPALIEAISNARDVYCIFIFDGHAAGTDTAKWNRMSFLLESLKDLDQSLRMYNGRLCVYHGNCVDILRQRFQAWNVTKLTFQQDPEAVWHVRDDAVKKLCAESGVECVECVSHTLWDPHGLMLLNGGRDCPPPVRFKEFVALCDKAGPPARPISHPVALFEEVIFRNSDDAGVPESPEFFSIQKEYPTQGDTRSYIGGEKAALALFDVRMNVEKTAIERGVSLPNQKYVNLLRPPLSLSPYLRFGCISVRKFYFAVHDAFTNIRGEEAKAPLTLTSQLLWREYFYLMSANNRSYAQISGNPVCYPIPWDDDSVLFDKWKYGQTGYPWIDACMRQLRHEGWIHQASRYSVASFLTRGDLWLDWQKGLQVFFDWLIDADWSLCAGNWMWVSSSAFEKALDHPVTAHPVRYGKAQDPHGDYIRRWVPELRRMPGPEYIYEPWRCPKGVQIKLGCVIGRDYPAPCIVHADAYQRNKLRMNEFCRGVLLSKTVLIASCAPSDTEEVAMYARLFDKERLTLLNVKVDESDNINTKSTTENVAAVDTANSSNFDAVNTTKLLSLPVAAPAGFLSSLQEIGSCSQTFSLPLMGQPSCFHIPNAANVSSYDGNLLPNLMLTTMPSAGSNFEPAGYSVVHNHQQQHYQQTQDVLELVNSSVMSAAVAGSEHAPTHRLASSSSSSTLTTPALHPHLYHPYSRPK